MRASGVASRIAHPGRQGKLSTDHTGERNSLAGRSSCFHSPQIVRFTEIAIMSILTKPSFAPSTAIIYITAGALLDAWTAVYYFSFTHDGTPETKQMTMFWLAGFFLTGLILMVIGFALGPIGRAARQAEMPPAEVTPQAAQADMNAANAPVVMPPAAQPTSVASSPTTPVVIARR
jgi:hypothetical protein